MRRWMVLLAVAIVILAVVAIYVQGAMGVPSPSPAGQPTEPPAATASPPQADWYELYFTKPQYPDDPKNHRGGIDERLVALMDRAQKTLDVADYDFDLSNVAEAMVRAKARGARVRMVTDTDTLTNAKDAKVQAAFKVLKDAGIPIVDDRRPAIMHDKFTVVDGEWVSTGSWNYTDGDTYHLNNWMAIFHSGELAANYTAEFEQMFAGKFGPAKTRNTPHPTLSIEGTKAQNCFSPKGNCADLIVSTVKAEAKQSIYFMAFSFTHDGIGQAIVDKQMAGVDVSGVFETTGSQVPASEYGKMKAAGLDVYTDGNPWVMHHKVVIIDGRTTVAGSFNFSQNADKDNDENLLIIENEDVARQFKAEFDRVLETAKHPPARKQPGPATKE